MQDSFPDFIQAQLDPTPTYTYKRMAEAMPLMKTKRKRIGKRETLRRLHEENFGLKNLIAQMQQQISAIEAQNDMLGEQLTFFRMQIQNEINKQAELSNQ